MNRKESAAWTWEDLNIWGNLALRWSAKAGIDVSDSICAIPQDRRDAELMWVWCRYLQGRGISPREWTEFCQDRDYIGPPQDGMIPS